MPSAGKAQHQGTSREGFSCGQGYSLRFLRGKRAVLFTAAMQRKGSLRQSYFSVQPRALCFTQHVWHLHVANAAVRRFERAFGATLKGRFANATEGQFFAAVFLPGQSGFSPLRRLVFSKASAPHGACRQTRKAFFRGRSGRFLLRRKKLGGFHSNLCLCAQKSLNFFEICLNFFQITIEKYLSVC